MVQHHNWSLTELENMIPFERQIYVDMLIEHVEQETEKMNQAKRSQKWQMQLLMIYWLN